MHAKDSFALRMFAKKGGSRSKYQYRLPDTHTVGSKIAFTKLSMQSLEFYSRDL